MRRVLCSFFVAILTLIGAKIARADTVTYTFVGEGGTSGTSWTLVDPNGYLTVPSGNVIDLVQTATDLILVDPMTGPADFGPLTSIFVGSPPLYPDYDGIQLASSSFTLSALFIPKTDFSTPGTYQLADLVEVLNKAPADQGTLTITATPEPRSAAIMLLGLGLIALLRKRKASAR